MINLRASKEKDLELIMAWRSNSLVYQEFPCQHSPLAFEEHYNWWKSQKNWRQWIISYGEGKYARDVGEVNVQNLNTDCPEIGYLIGEIPLWGKGVGKQAVNKALDWLRKKGYKKVSAKVLDKNEGSKRLLYNLGFKLVNGTDILVLEMEL
jgi:RimJ/RimL family protein N-acetyltransferase